MRHSTKALVIAGIAAAVAAGVGAHPAAACFRHTFEPCPATSSTAYEVEVDSKTGRTWIKDRPTTSSNGEEMAELAASAAKSLEVHPVATSEADWQTRVNATSRRN
jgi:hypothetical protein